jgi:leucyl aminopeptidase
VLRLAHGCGAKAAWLTPPGTLTAEALVPLAQGATLGRYRYDTYKGAQARQKLAAQAPLQALQKIVVEAAGGAEQAHALQVGQTLAMAVAVARDLVNCPPNALYPESFAAQAKKLAAQFGVGIKVLGPKELTKLGMGMIMGVGAGSERLPRLVHLSYAGKGQKKTAPTLLVGKGVTFDSGGLCLKTCDGMGTMKMDMGGAAAVLATVLGAAALKLDVHVQGVLALAENMPSGHALRPGDVLTSASGLTVEVNNTDAEGRLVLGDALHFGIQRARPAKIIDVATLTGACMVALGPHTTGLFSNDDGLAQSLLAAADHGGEHMWRLPLTEALAEQLRSDVADLRNTGDRYGGAITAALFLQRFVGEIPWAHLDIAGPAWASSESSTRRKGGTGAAVSSLLQLLLADHRGAPKGGGGGRRTRGQ